MILSTSYLNNLKVLFYLILCLNWIKRFIAYQIRIILQKLYFDRNKQEAFYNNYGRVIKEKQDTIDSKIGNYILENKKYEFKINVLLKSPKYEISTPRLDYYTENGHAYFYGATQIKSEESDIYCELGFYNTNNDTGYFIKESKVDFNNSTILADSIYFDRNTKY